jgi:DNA-binding NarL/FixJ family response regulator
VRHSPIRQVGICHVSGGYRRGVIVELERAGIAVVDVDRQDVRRWLTDAPSAVLLFSIDVPSDCEWLQELLCEAPTATAIALVSPLSSSTAGSAISAGASGVLDRDGDPAGWAEVVALARRGVVSFLGDELRVLVRDKQTYPALVSEDVELLRALVANVPMEKMAMQFGHSVRTMHRRLKCLYCRMGVQDRGDAIRSAFTRGLAETDNEQQAKSLSLERGT